jgi:hypothetical protein
MEMNKQPNTQEIADACRRLARLLDESKDNSGPWMMIPDAAKTLYELLGPVVAPARASAANEQEQRP